MDSKQMMLEALVETIEKHHADSIAFAIVYGSYVTSLTGPKSDLDVVFAGKDQRAFEMQRTFIFDGIGYDFWCMPMGRVERIVNEFQPLVSIFAEGRLVYADTPERKNWFSDLQQQLRMANSDSSPMKFARAIEELLTKMKALAFDHRVAGLSQKPHLQRHLQGNLVLLAGDMLARINRTYFRSGIKRYLEQIAAFELKPRSVSHRLDLMMRDIAGTEEVAALVLELEQYWSGVKMQHGEPLNDNDLRGFYEEGLSTWNKIEQAAGNGDFPLTVLAATSLENELAGFRSKGIALTPMFEGSPAEPTGIALNAGNNHREFVAMLEHRGVPILEFNDIADVLRFIRNGPVVAHG